MMREAGEGFRWVTTNGCFDLLHAGHITSLEAARALGDGLVVGLNSDASVRALKGPSRPVIGQADRALVLAALECVDAVVIFDEENPLALLEVLRPQVHAKGGDYIAAQLPEYPLVRSWGGEVEILPMLEGRSTSSILSRL
jgi:rfaE bifunctional protein nucleotidyltransferase chain/domain